MSNEGEDWRRIGNGRWDCRWRWTLFVLHNPPFGFGKVACLTTATSAFWLLAANNFPPVAELGPHSVKRPEDTEGPHATERVNELANLLTAPSSYHDTSHS